MKKFGSRIVMVAAATLLLVGAAVAQPGYGGRGGPGWGGDRMDRPFWDELDLSDEQEEQMEAIRDSHRSAMQAWREQNPDATRAERREFREQLHSSGRAALDDILTPEQLELFDTRRREMRDRGWGRGKHDGRARGGFGMSDWGINLDRLTERLDLTPEQVGKITEIRARHLGEVEMEMTKILTSEQIEEWNRIKERRRGR